MSDIVENSLIQALRLRVEKAEERILECQARNKELKEFLKNSNEAYDYLEKIVNDTKSYILELERDNLELENTLKYQQDAIRAYCDMANKAEEQAEKLKAIVVSVAKRACDHFHPNHEVNSCLHPLAGQRNNACFSCRAKIALEK